MNRFVFALNSLPPRVRLAVLLIPLILVGITVFRAFRLLFGFTD